MRKSMRVKHFVAPALLTLAAMGLGTGCSSAKNALAGNCGTGDAGASLTAKFDAFKAAVTDLNDVQGTITSKVAIACVNIAKGLDSTTNASLPTYTDGQVVSSTDTDTACKAASAAITKIKANGAVTIAVVASAPSCTVDASAQVDCSAKCNVSASCTPPTVEASCSPANLSGTCSATCSGSCTVEAKVAATCDGTCNGTCEGTCNGQTGTAGNGVACNGTCSAGCKGECKAAAGATASCTGTCSGGCSVKYTAPKCDVLLRRLRLATPPLIAMPAAVARRLSPQPARPRPSRLQSPVRQPHPCRRLWKRICRRC